MSLLKIFKLVVQPTSNCVELLRYLDANIEAINRLGVGVRVEKISKNDDENMVEIMRKKGITRLPALIAPDGKLFIGSKQIQELFDRNLSTARNNNRMNPVGGAGRDSGDSRMGADSEDSTGSYLTDYYMREMYTGSKDGKLIPREDKEDDDFEGNTSDIDKRLAEYRKHAPKHHREPSPDDSDDEVPNYGNRGNRGGNNGNHNNNMNNRRGKGDARHDDPDDNIASDDEYDVPVRAPKLEPSGDNGGDDLDRRMLAAWMANSGAANS